MTSEPIRWWEIQDVGSWPGVQPRPSLYLEDGLRRPPMKIWTMEDQKVWRLRPHP